MLRLPPTTGEAGLRPFLRQPQDCNALASTCRSVAIRSAGSNAAAGSLDRFSGSAARLRAEDRATMKCLLLADTVVKRFFASERAILIQDQAPMRNVDSRIGSL